jgi:hypothetical protein
MNNYVKWQDTVLDTVDDLLRSRRSSQANHVKSAVPDRDRKKVEKPHEWKKLRLRSGLVDGVR